MSILIKGMEMPTSCDMCWALDDYGDYPRCRITEEQRGYNFRIRENRMDKCPLVPVPPHGDLISREWLIDIALHLLNAAKNEDIANGVKWLWQYIINAPTIIPAEGDE